jgi:transglutaminase-like putative cysteine protease
MKLTASDIYSLTNKQIVWILLSVTVAVLPHIPRLPIWFGLLLALVVLTRWLIAQKKITPMPGLFVSIITIFIFIEIIYFQGFSLNREISVTLLTTMTVLKLLETWRKRDAWMVVTLCYFVILTRFFYSQDMLLLVYLLSSVIIITHTLFVLQHSNTENIIQKREVKETLSLLAAGVPLAVLFFLFFPRLGSPIWGSPDFFGEGKTGMSEEMSPGSISQLFNDDSTAFRVIFDSVIPAKNHLYWRGPVLWNFDGKTWTTNKNSIFADRPNSFTQSSPKITYEVELEPTGQHYLFALDYVIKPPPKSRILTDSQLMSESEINQLRHYKTTSVLKKYNLYELLSRKKLNRLTALPKGFNPQTIALMQQWRKLNLTPEQLINKALSLFAKDEFYYSYSPPLLYGDTVDQFLFGTKKGFCEHYASAFTVMMRAAGLPARVVTGYQGGIQNEGYLLIKQSDAHAWSEVWIPNKGWLRVDPTAAVSPLRVEEGSQALMSENARNWLDSSWYRKLGERFDGVRHKWNTWVRDYNATKQKALFEVFGFDSQDGKAIAIILGSIMLLSTLIVLLFLYLTRPRRILSHYDKIYQKYLSIFIKKGLNKTNDMGVTEFADIASKQYPQVQRSINDFTQLYLKLRFSKFSKKQTNLDKRLLNIIIKIKNQIGNKK